MKTKGESGTIKISPMRDPALRCCPDGIMWSIIPPKWCQKKFGGPFVEQDFANSKEGLAKKLCKIGKFIQKNRPKGS